MFTPARVVVIDDNPDHLTAIRDALEALGSSCVCVTYDDEKGDPPALPFSRARVIFMDLQLRSRQASTDFKVHFVEIQRLLSKLIPEDGGPFLLVVWTDKPEQVEALEKYLEANLYTKHPHARPVKLLGMSKTEFISLDTGTARDPEALRTHVMEQVASVPALAALLKWETEIIQATDRVVHDVLGLGGAAGADGPPNVAVALRRIATEAVGEPNVSKDPQGAVHSALLPLLQDHVQYEVVMDPDSPDVWTDALAGTGDLPDLTREQAADLNARLHLGGSHGALVPTTWGAVCEVEKDLPWNAEFGLESAETFRAHLLKRIKDGKGGLRPAGEDVRLLQIRIGASCDYAQRTDGPIPFALGAFVPVAYHPEPAEGEQRSTRPLGPLELVPDTTSWLSPMLRFDEWGVGHLLVDPRFVRVRGADAAASFVAVNRVREQLLMELIAVVAQHGARPGIVRFLGRDNGA